MHISFFFAFHPSHSIKIDDLVYSSLVKLSNSHMHLQKTLDIVSNKLFYRKKKDYRNTIGEFLLILGLQCLNFGMDCLWQVSL